MSSDYFSFGMCMFTKYFHKDTFEIVIIYDFIIWVIKFPDEIISKICFI